MFCPCGAHKATNLFIACVAFSTAVVFYGGSFSGGSTLPFQCSFRGYRTTMLPGRRGASGSGRRRVATTHSRGAAGTSRDSSQDEEGGSDPAPTARGSRWGPEDHVLVHISLPSTSGSDAFVSTSAGSSRQGGGTGRHRGDRREPEYGRNIRRSERCAPVSMRRWVLT